MIKYNNSDIIDWNFDDNDIIKVYYHDAIVFYKFDTEQGGYKVCYAVVDDITQYSDREFEDVYDKATEKWYKLNNLNQYEEYGIYGSGRSVTTYDGKLTIDGTQEYEWNGSSWVNLGEVSGSSRVPVGYTEVEYVENTSQAYLNLGVVLYDGDGTTWSISTRFASEPQAPSFDTFAYLLSTENTAEPYYGFTMRWQNGYNFVIGGNPKNLVYDLVDNGDGTSGATITCPNATTNNNTPLTMFVGTDGNFGQDYWRNGTGKFYTLQLTKNNVLVRNLAPAKRDSDDKYGMYDLVTDTFYLSPNNVDFSGGEPITPSEYPKYYSEKSDPLDNLTFNTMAEAQAYAEANCVYVGLKATIDGVKYIFSGDSQSGYEWVVKPSRLPQGYTEVEYIESNGTQYINTNAYITNTANFEVGYNILSNRLNWGYVHQMVVNGAWVTAAEDKAYFGRFNSSYWVDISNQITTGNNTIVYKSNSGITVNETFNAKTLRLTSTDNITTIPLHILGWWDFYSNAVDCSASTKLKSFYLKVNGVLIRDLVPAKRDSDNKYGMYDLVTDTFYVSPNGNNFIGGDPV